MASKIAGSKDTYESATGATMEQVSSSLPIYEDTKLILDKDIKPKWQVVNDAFTGTFGEYLEDLQVYINIHKSSFYRIACRFHAFSSRDMIHWIILCTDPDTMTWSSVSKTRIATFRVVDYDEIYQMSEPMTIMETPFNLPSNNGNSRDILKK